MLRWITRDDRYQKASFLRLLKTGGKFVHAFFLIAEGQAWQLLNEFVIWRPFSARLLLRCSANFASSVHGNMCRRCDRRAWPVTSTQPSGFLFLRDGTLFAPTKDSKSLTASFSWRGREKRRENIFRTWMQSWVTFVWWARRQLSAKPHMMTLFLTVLSWNSRRAVRGIVSLPVPVHFPLSPHCLFCLYGGYWLFNLSKVIFPTHFVSKLFAI